MNLTRLLALIRKEFIQIRRDRRTLGMMVAIPVLWIVIFGYAASFDVKEVPTAVVGPRAQAVAALNARNAAFHAVNIFEDPELREALKALGPKLRDKSAQQKLLAAIKDPEVRDKILAMITAPEASGGGEAKKPS